MCSVIEKAFLKILQILQKNTCVEPLLNKVVSLQAYNFLKETPTDVFSCEICDIFKNTYFEKHLRRTASENSSEGTHSCVRACMP